jgi:uncharacterized FlaG/YvyC family protein
MDLVKPIEGAVNDVRGQSIAVAQQLQARYNEQRAQQLPPPPPPDASEPVAEERREHSRPTEEARTPTISMRHTYAEFEVSRENHEVTVRIIDGQTGKLIRTIPPEELAREIARGNLYPNQLRRRAVFV